MIERFRQKPLWEKLTPDRMYQTPRGFLPLSELLPEIKRENRLKRVSNAFVGGFSGFAVGCFGIATTYGFALSVPHVERVIMFSAAAMAFGMDQWARAHGGISFFH